MEADIANDLAMRRIERVCDWQQVLSAREKAHTERTVGHLVERIVKHAAAHGKLASIKRDRSATHCAVSIPARKHS